MAQRGSSNSGANCRGALQKKPTCDEKANSEGGRGNITWQRKLPHLQVTSGHSYLLEDACVA